MPDRVGYFHRQLVHELPFPIRRKSFIGNLPCFRYLLPRDNANPNTATAIPICRLGHALLRGLRVLHGNRAECLCGCQSGIRRTGHGDERKQLLSQRGLETELVNPVELSFIGNRSAAASSR